MNKVEKKDFKERFSNARKKNDFTQAQMASLLNVTLGMYQKYEYGTCSMQHNTIIKVSQILNLSLDYLYLGKSANMELVA